MKPRLDGRESALFEALSSKVIFTSLPHFLSFIWCWRPWAWAADLTVRQLEANVTVKTQWHSPLPKAPVSYIKRGGFLYTVRWLQTLFLQIPDVDNVSISYWELPLNLQTTFRVTDLNISSLRVSSGKKRVVEFHFLAGLSPSGDPVFEGPGACGGHEGLKEDARARPVLLAAAPLRAGRS